MARPLHIAIDVRRIRGFGIGTYIRNLVQALARIDDQNRYTLVTPVGPPDQMGLADLGPNFTLLPYARNDLGFAHSIHTPRLFRSLKADICHIPLNTVPWTMPRPYVLTIHDMSSLLFPAKKDTRYMLHEMRYRRGAERAAHIIAVSNATRRDIEEVLRLPSDKISTIYSAPDSTFCHEGPGEAFDQAILQRYSITYPYILYAGTTRPRKNLPRLVEAFAVLREELEQSDRYRELRLVIIGDELSKNPAVRQAVAHARIEPFVRFFGFVPIETLGVFYRKAELFAFPSLYEGWGLAPLEAMACGTPVVTSNIPSLAEAVGECAELVTPDNVFDIARGLSDVLHDDQRRASMAAAGRQHVAQFSWNATAKKVLEIYNSIPQ